MINQKLKNFKQLKLLSLKYLDDYGEFSYLDFIPI